MLRRIAGLLEMMGQFLSTCVGVKGRTCWRKTMMRATNMLRWPILTEFILRLHLYIYSGNLRYCFVPCCTPEWFDDRGRLEIGLRFEKICLMFEQRDVVVFLVVEMILCLETFEVLYKHLLVGIYITEPESILQYPAGCFVTYICNHSLQSYQHLHLSTLYCHIVACQCRMMCCGISS